MKFKIFLLSLCSTVFCSSVIPGTVQVFTPPAAYSAMTCSFDLLLHEGGAHDGHAIANHVAKSDSFLFQRLTNEGLPAASTYASLKQAQSLTNAAICEDQTKLDDFLKNAKDKQTVVFRKRSTSVTGTLMKRDKTKKDVYGVEVVAQKKSIFADKFVIITSYPADI